MHMSTKNSDSNIKIEILKNQVRKLTNEIKQLNSNMSEIMIKMITLEESENPYYNVQPKSAPKEGEPNSEYLKWNECNFICETNHALTIHVGEEHEVAEFFQCKMCKSCFDTKNQLNKHTNTKHLSTDRDDFRFKCKVCNKVFWNGLDLGKT